MLMTHILHPSGKIATRFAVLRTLFTAFRRLPEAQGKKPGPLVPRCARSIAGEIARLGNMGLTNLFPRQEL
jgi:hypothetical protein